MIKLLSTICLILAIVLSPPAVLAVVSNNAVPGDLTYPIKRGLEDVIYAVASLNPTTKAWFAGARSNKRYEEVTALLAQGKTADETLQELVEQTQIAATEINQVSDPVRKEELISQLSDSITKYDAGLARVSQKANPVNEALVQPRPDPSVSVESPRLPRPVPQQTVLPQPSIASKVSGSSGAVDVPQASNIPNVSPVPLPAASQPTPDTVVSLSPSMPVVPSPAEDSNIDKARKEFGRIKKELEQERHKENIKENKVNEEQGKNEVDRNKKSGGGKEKKEKREKD